MNNTTVSEYDCNNRANYTVSDKLYASSMANIGSNNGIYLGTEYWQGCSYLWTRTPYDAFANTVYVMTPDCYTTTYRVDARPVGDGDPADYPGVQPAANLDLTSVSFASAVPAVTAQDGNYSVIANGTAMTLRLDGKDKGIGSAAYNPSFGMIKAVKGDTSEAVKLVVQGFDGTNNWYWSKQIDSSSLIYTAEIKSDLSLASDVDLSRCKVWLETVTDGFTYAVKAEISSFTPAVGDGSAENPYQIGSVEELYSFAQIVNGGNTGANAILTADITVNSNVLYSYGGDLAADPNTLAVWSPIGSTDNPYTGIFDGNNCTVSGLYLDSESNIVGLFGWNKGTIKNVGVMDSYLKGGNSVGGICGFNQGGTVSGCFNTGTVNGKKHIGGVCGWSDGTVIGCDNTGKVLGEENVGGVCGYNNGTVTGAYNYGSVLGDSVSGAVCGKNNADGTISGCYYLEGSNTVGLGEGTGTAYACSADEFKDGTVCVLLNSALYSADSDVRFYQGSRYPEFSSVPRLVDGVYQIGNAAELYGFARLVNQGERNADAVLTNDIVVNVGDVAGSAEASGAGFAEWTPIGFDYIGYSGSFDGQNHTVSGLYFNDSSARYVGLFGSSNNRIANVGVINSYFNGSEIVGAVCGENNKGIVENCYANSTVRGNRIIGGVCGMNTSGTVKNSYNNGNVSGENYVGGVCGSNSGRVKVDSVITNCYSSGVISGKLWIGGVCGRNYAATVSESYYNTTAYKGEALGANEGGVETNVEGKSAVEFKNGTVAYLLQNNDGGEVWGQDLSLSNSLPVLDSGKKVYRVSVTYCDNTTGTGYSNTDSPLTGVHRYEYTNGFCAGCANSYQPADFNSAENRYEISNAGQLYWFANYVNSGNVSVNAVLMNDIVINEDLLSKLNADGTVKDGSTVKSWTPIGNGSRSYYGSFDGRGYTVSGVYINDSNGEYLGLFGCVKSKGVSNIGVVNSYISGSAYVGTVCGSSYAPLTNCYGSGTVKGNVGIGGVCGDLSSDYGSSGSLSSCGFTGSVSGLNNVGGVCGISGGNEIKNVYNKGSVSGGSNVGGICGYNSGTIKNAYNIGTVNGNENFGGICGSNDGTVSNCYYNAGTFGGEAIGQDYNQSQTSAEKKTDDAFTGGEIAYLLSQGDNGSVWGQDLSVTNGYPALNSGKKVYKNMIYAGCVNNPGAPVGVIYTNTNKDVYAEHTDADNDGICDNGCGQYLRAVVREVSATLNGDIGLNYYIGLPQSVSDDSNAYVRLSVNSRSYTLPVGEASNLNGVYKFTIWLNAKEMRDDVTFALYAGDGTLVDLYSRKGAKLEGAVFNYTLEKYLTALSAVSDGELKELADATLIYGAYAQTAFNHNPDASFDGSELTGVTADTLASYKMSKSAAVPDGLTLTEVTLILNTRTAFRLYFKTDNIGAYTFSLDGNELKPSYIADEDLYYIELADIHAKELDTGHTLSINNECDISFCALSYAYSVLKADSDTNIVNVCKALYLYNEAANAYFNK